MKLGALGDVHGDSASVRAIMHRHPEVHYWVTVGDLADANGEYQSPPAPLHWIKGNNDNLEVVAGLIDGGRDPLHNLHYIPNGVAMPLGPIVVAGLGGTFAPTWYDRSAADVPRPKLVPPRGAFPPMARDDKRRHFLHDEVERLRKLDRVDLFVSHEAARPFHLEVRGRRQDVGKTPINEVLASLRPRMHLSGHHHVYHDDVRQGIRSIGLGPVGQSYVLIDLDTWKYERIETPPALVGDDGEVAGNGTAEL
ncbi:MAG: metallophosphoesterase family protein [Acidobacteriota bacterium]